MLKNQGRSCKEAHTFTSSSEIKFFIENIRGFWLITVSVIVFPAIGEVTPVSITWPILGASQTKFKPSGFVNHLASASGGILVLMSNRIKNQNIFRSCGNNDTQTKSDDCITCDFVELAIRIHYYVHFPGMRLEYAVCIGECRDRLNSINVCDRIKTFAFCVSFCALTGHRLQ